jgi:hypothetical protein
VSQLRTTYERDVLLEQAKAWRTLDYGMFIHFGMSTFEGVEHPYRTLKGSYGR